jgi:hypothetical protein
MRTKLTKREMECFDGGGYDTVLEAGMFVRKPTSGTFKVLATHEDVVWMCQLGQRPGTVNACAIRDWEGVGGWECLRPNKENG